MNSLNGVLLDEELVWLDEWSWTPMAQTVAFAVTGDLIAQHGLKRGGRPLTLVGRLQQPQLATLFELLLVTAPMTLLLFGRTFRVCWRHNDGPIQTTPDYEVANPAEFPELGHTVILRLTEV